MTGTFIDMLDDFTNMEQYLFKAVTGQQNRAQVSAHNHSPQRILHLNLLHNRTVHTMSVHIIVHTSLVHNRIVHTTLSCLNEVEQHRFNIEQCASTSCFKRFVVNKEQMSVIYILA